MGIDLINEAAQMCHYLRPGWAFKYSLSQTLLANYFVYTFNGQHLLVETYQYNISAVFV